MINWIKKLCLTRVTVYVNLPIHRFYFFDDMIISARRGKRLFDLSSKSGTYIVTLIIIAEANVSGIPNFMSET